MEPGEPVDDGEAEVVAQLGRAPTRRQRLGDDLAPFERHDEERYVEHLAGLTRREDGRDGNTARAPDGGERGGFPQDVVDARRQRRGGGRRITTLRAPSLARYVRLA
ncbi:hypothetical protein GCM10025867_26000 [Frondihabitans sucicola]|uniref:Uncharacterized protein n=1 Tax=Frondihabitans sucicola TaxID=1268041 RepID=A0ABN6XZA7_9MICO|nr:hypothetical protein GCM10025867_26000 [Frondihabitans sucicola]